MGGLLAEAEAFVGLPDQIGPPASTCHKNIVRGRLAAEPSPQIIAELWAVEQTAADLDHSDRRSPHVKPASRARTANACAGAAPLIPGPRVSPSDTIAADVADDDAVGEFAGEEFTLATDHDGRRLALHIRHHAAQGLFKQSALAA